MVCTTLDLPQHADIAGHRLIICQSPDIGCFFGAIAAFVVGDKLGRKKTVLLGTTIMSVGAILQITTYSVAQMVNSISLSLQ